MTFQQETIHYLGHNTGSLQRDYRLHHRRQKLNLTSQEELNKMSKKTPSQDSNFENPRPEEEIAWDIEECRKAIRDAADDYDKLVGG